jgi:hypothetical protein
MSSAGDAETALLTAAGTAEAAITAASTEAASFLAVVFFMIKIILSDKLKFS